MIKLYHLNDFESRYWEAWEHDGQIVYHWGVLGERGEKKKVPLPKDMTPLAAMERESRSARKEGFVELEMEDLAELVIQFRLKGWGTGKDLDRRHTVENLINEVLGWTGLGHCDGGDIGSGALNIYCFVVDPKLAAKITVDALREKKLIDGAVIATQSEEDYVVLWPENYGKPFELI